MCDFFKTILLQEFHKQHSDKAYPYREGSETDKHIIEILGRVPVPCSSIFHGIFNFHVSFSLFFVCFLLSFFLSYLSIFTFFADLLIALPSMKPLSELREDAFVQPDGPPSLLAGTEMAKKILDAVFKIVGVPPHNILRTNVVFRPQEISGNHYEKRKRSIIN